MYSHHMQKPDYISPALPHAGALRQREKPGAILRSWFGSALRRWKQQRTIAALEALDDRLLHDVGLTRSDIRKVVLHSEERELGMAPSATRDEAYLPPALPNRSLDSHPD